MQRDYSSNIGAWKSLELVIIKCRRAFVNRPTSGKASKIVHSKETEKEVSGKFYDLAEVIYNSSKYSNHSINSLRLSICFTYFSHFTELLSHKSVSPEYHLPTDVRNDMIFIHTVY